MNEFQERMCSLTPTERIIVHMLEEGKTSKEIAFDLGRSEHTVKKHHMTRIYMKLGITGSAGGQGKKAKELRKKLAEAA